MCYFLELAAFVSDTLCQFGRARQLTQNRRFAIIPSVRGVSVYGDEECVLSIPEGDVLAGAMPARQLRNLQTFIDMRTAELELDWKLCMEGKDVIWIDPIR